MTVEKVREELFKNSEEKYKKFTEKLIPETENILGVRTPVLKNLAKKIIKEGRGEEYDLCDDMYYHEEFIVQGMVIGFLKADFEEKRKFVEKFIPKIKNWAVCDNFCSVFKVPKKDKEKVWEFLEKYFVSKEEYEVRFAIIMSLKHFMCEKYLEKIFIKLDNLKNNNYYVQMGAAWVIAEGFTKYSEITLKYILKNNLDNFTHNKAIQKICESLRVDSRTKEYLKSLKRK